MLEFDFTKTDVDSEALTSEIVAAGLPTPARINWESTGSPNLHIYFPSHLDEGQQTTLSNTVDNHPTLDTYKERKQDAIDVRTRELIDQGFVYDNHTFSLSEQAQMNIVGLKVPIDSGWITFPHKMSTTDDTVEYELADAAAFDAIYQTALGTIKARMDSGRDLKKQVAACTTVAEVEAIVDPR